MQKNDLKSVENKRELLVIGNGFDLECGLKTQYEDFFFEKYGINLIAEIDSEKNSELEFEHYQKLANQKFIKEFSKAINEQLDINRLIKENKDAYGYLVNYFSQRFKSILHTIDPDNLNNNLRDKRNKKLKTKFTNWDIVFISSYILMKKGNEFKWIDIEKAIFEVITTVLLEKKDVFSEEDFLNKYSKDKFIGIVKYCFREKKDISTSMLDSLVKFEKSFADYIGDQLNEKWDKYLPAASKLLEILTRASQKQKVKLDVINFNYSLDENLIDYMKRKNYLPNIEIHSWTNIHGIALWNNAKTRANINKIHGKKQGKMAAPIFGIDGHDILTSKINRDLNLDDPRIIFTKSFRLIDNKINLMRDREHQIQSKMDKIIFFGHSLGHADYSYFESLFDICDIFNSNVELEFYYHHHEQSLENRIAERLVLKRIVNLLTSYGETVPEQHGENIVNRLVLEQRLNLLPSPDIK
ncbi:AbiH family protein [Lactobacillus sp. PV012]|uniref:AbiH family protein n=1 Tax=Lactobacillus sp. PV012 TaxID=2594494 RepID=UPI002240E2B9|nr:AbiH family protein [Lactobacillus sp. PV012]QNQ82759.1 hypothetical protein FP433_06780 [Lactobacillus sp. PV012]